jgi:DNA-binding NtrC family response regulator
MAKKIIVLDADENQCHGLCSILDEREYHTEPIHSLPHLKKMIQDTECLVVIMDIDTVSMDNRTIRELTIKYPETYFLCLSSDRFHPHLKEALCYHIYACLNKPVDLDELFYWLRSIYEDDSDSTNKTEV